MKLLLLVFLGGITLFSYPTELSPNTNHAVGEISKAAGVDSSFVAAVIAVSNPDGVPDTNDLFATGDTFTSTAASIVHFCKFIQSQNLSPEELQDPVKTTITLSEKKVLKDYKSIIKHLLE